MMQGYLSVVDFSNVALSRFEALSLSDSYLHIVNFFLATK
jgi:hypothetical protein